MFVYKLIVCNNVLLLLFFHVTDCQRRITDGEIVEGGRKYMVYFSKSAISPKYYSGWICGGALVSADFIVTSAACVTDVVHLYAIAGYSQYVTQEEILNNPCTKEKKKKVVLICTPKAYKLVYDELETWSYIDIAVVKVESPYDFNDETYETICSYTPAPIIINYDQKYQEPGTDALVFGWGHHRLWRKEEDLQDYNQQTLNYASALIQSKEECKKEYLDYEKMGNVIDKYMICTQDAGNINDKGEAISTPAPEAEGCDPQMIKLKAYEDQICENVGKDGEEILLIENSRKGSATNIKRNGTNENRKFSQNAEILNNVVDFNPNQNYSKHNRSLHRRLNTRRHGNCQNDHGGPLVTWIGAHEVLIGIASVFKITEDFTCVGPYLYASTQCNGRFLDCILRDDPNQTPGTRREFCDKPASEKGFELIERHVSWKDHPHGPADNERNISSSTNTSTLNLKPNIEKVPKLEENKTILTPTSINTTITNLIFNKNITSENFLYLPTVLTNANINVKKEKKIQGKYHNSTKNVMNPMISNQNKNATILNQTINTTISNQILNTTIYNQTTNTTISNHIKNSTISNSITHATVNPTITSILMKAFTTHPSNTTTENHISNITTIISNVTKTNLIVPNPKS